MKRFLLLFALASFSFSYAQTEDDRTVYYFIRHAEKATVKSENPHLSGAGLERVEKWKTYFENKSLDAVFSTNYHRTMETATPIAEIQNLEVRNYKAERLNVKDLVKKPKGKRILIVGHSNTIPMQVNALIQDDVYKDMDESIYDRLYIVTFQNGNVSHKVTEIN
ncbi:hypothetical protein GCM10009117_09140 [Gangjinia marincola]|uniref:Phosphoglycerate mutase n=1 Tax=Gangjinia marincola TaxID=578463 RepID=A0ABP3XQZ3_9FLAO